jgi:hypothetical protein
MAQHLRPAAKAILATVRSGQHAATFLSNADRSSVNWKMSGKAKGRRPAKLVSARPRDEPWQKSSRS